MKSYSWLIFCGILLLLFLYSNSRHDKLSYSIQVISNVGDNNYSDMVKDLGVDYVREDVRWNKIEQKKGIYNFSFYDKVVDAWTSRGIKPMLLVFYGNPLYKGTTSIGQGDGSNIPSNDAEFDTFVKAYGNYTYEIVSHFKGKVNHFQIFNEYDGNLNRELGSDIQTMRYVKLLKEAYKRAKEANPDSVIISSGIGTEQVQKNNYVDKFFYYGGAGYYDKFAVHSYCYWGTFYGGISRCNQVRNLQPIYDLMKQYGDGDKKIWVTETGMPSSGDGYKDGALIIKTTNLSVSNQALAITETMNEFKKYPFIENVFWFTFRDRPDQPVYNVEHNFGIVYANGTAKPAYYTYKNVIAEYKQTFK